MSYKLWTDDPKLTQHIFDDFNGYVTATELGWTTVTGSSGTSVASGANGRSELLLTTAATDNDEQGVRSTLAAWGPRAGRAGFVETKITFANQAGNNANIAFGVFKNTSAFLDADGAGITAGTNDVLAVWKGDGHAAWRATSLNGGAGSTSISDSPAVDGTYRLRVDWREEGDGNIIATYFANDVQLLDATYKRPIAHRLALSGMENSVIALVIAAGSANAQLLYADYILGKCLR